MIQAAVPAVDRSRPPAEAGTQITRAGPKGFKVAGRQPWPAGKLAAVAFSASVLLTKPAVKPRSLCRAAWQPPEGLP